MSELYGVALWHDMTTIDHDAYGYVVERRHVGGNIVTEYRHREKSAPSDKWTPGLPEFHQQQIDKLMANTIGNLAKTGIVEAIK